MHAWYLVPSQLVQTTFINTLHIIYRISFKKITDEIKERKEKIWSFKRIMESTEAPPVEFMEQLNAFIPVSDTFYGQLGSFDYI